MDLQHAMEATVTRQQAQREIAKHSAEWSKFVAEHGDHETYRGETVLGWLGY
jgi:hypothetical protein